MQAPTTKQLLYNKIRFSLLDYIASNHIPSGGKLPPERELARILCCSSGTMRTALGELEACGVIEKRHGIGNFLRSELAASTPQGRILFISVILEDDLASTVSVDYIRQYFRRYMMCLHHISVSRYGQEVIENAAGCLGILVYGWVTDEFLSQLAMLKIPVLVIGNNQLKSDVPIVSYDITAMAYRLTDYFIQNGKRRIAFWGKHPGYYPAEEGFRGYSEAMLKAGLPYHGLIAESEECYMRYCDVRRFMETTPDVEAVIAEYPAMNAFNTYLWENPKIPLPAFGFYNGLPQGQKMMQQKNLFKGAYQNSSGLVAAEMLLKHITRNLPMKSVAIPPVLHGIDDNIREFQIF